MAPTNTAPQKKGLRIGKALRSAAKLPSKVSSGKSNGRNRFAPLQGENPIVIVRVQILSAKDLLAKDRNGASDPFVVVSVLSHREQTPVSKKTINPVYSPKDSTFDFPIHLSLADKLGVLELILWDKDMLMKKEYLGEAALPLEDWFREGDNGRIYAWEDAPVMDIPLVSTRTKLDARGTVQIRLGFVKLPHVEMEFADIFAELNKLSRPSVVSAAPTEGVGTIRSNQMGIEFQDDGLSSDEEDEDDEIDISIPGTPLAVDVPQPAHPVPPPVIISESSPSTPTAESVARTPVVSPSPVTAKPSSPAFNLPKIFPSKRPSLSTHPSSDQTATTPSGASTPATTSSSISRPSSASGKPNKKAKFRKSWVQQKKTDYNFNAAQNDVLGIVMLEIQGASDLPKLKNMTRLGWDMDPFVVISFGKKVFRTRVIRHSLNPVWEEKMLFHVRRYESNFKIQFSILDWDKLSSNDHIGDVSFDIAELMAAAPKRDEETGLYDEGEEGNHPMKDFKVQLVPGKESAFDSKPVLTFRAKYQPYDALRQQFWRQYLKQYDADENGTISRLELTSMLDSLGSTLSRETVDSFYTRYGKNPQIDSISFSEGVQCLEIEIGRPTNERKKVDFSHEDDTTPSTPSGLSGPAGVLALDKLDFSGPGKLQPHQEPQLDTARKPIPPPTLSTEPNQMTADDLANVVPNLSTGDLAPPLPLRPGQMQMNRHASSTDSDDPDESGSGSSNGSGNGVGDDSRERVINVKNCPLCHRPRLNSKAEMDIVTHLAICASQDWNRVDKIVVGNFVTASQAQRKWYTKIVSKISSGDYRLGANSANIIVQNRMTGQLEEEKMQVYVRLGIRLLYKGAKSRMEGGRARSLLKSMSIKQGIKYDAPESAKDIPAFIEFHNLDVREILDPIDSFKTFNEFFYRKLKPDARPVERPDDPYRLVSGADCRMMAFETVSEATRLWIKGREFTTSRLLGEAYSDQAERYNGGALCIFRLAPQDYHRFHVPVDGTIGNMTLIAGEYYTVNPQAIRTALDVYGENVRMIVPIDSPQFGRVMAVCIGAMMVGSIKTTVQEGQQVKRGDEFGYFAFGGSTIVVLFEKGAVEWDEDLLINGRASLETLVRVGMGVGTGRRPVQA